MIPMIDYLSPLPEDTSRMVYQELGLRSEQADKLQNINNSLLNIQRFIQLYCSQMHLFTSISSKTIKDLIDSIEESNSDDINYLMNIIKGITEEKMKQTGGVGGNNIKFFMMLFKILFLILLMSPGTTATGDNTFNNLELISTQDNAYNPYNMAIISENNNKVFTNNLITAVNQQNQIDISKTIRVYDENFKQKYDGLFGSLLAHINAVEPTAQQGIINIVNDINGNLMRFSENVTNNCKDLMKVSYDKGIFSTWKTFDDIETTKRKIDIVEKMIQDKNSESISKAGATTVAAMASATTGDFASTAWYLGQAGESLWNLISSSKKKQEELELVMQEQPSQLLTTEEKKRLENNLYKYSKLYCTFGYNLQLAFDGNSINVVGGKLDYNWIVNLINVLEENLKTEITNLSSESNNDVSKLIELKLLVSTSQKLDILKAITNKLSDVVNFSVYSHIMNLQIQPSLNTIDQIKSFFDGQLVELNDLLNKLNTFFPKQKEELGREKELIEAEMEIKKMEQTILDIKQNTTNIIEQRQAERYSNELNNAWTVTETYFKGWLNISNNAIKLTGESVKTTLGGLTREISDVVTVIPKEIINSNLQFLNSILLQLFMNPSGWLIMSVPLFMFSIYFGNLTGLIRTFTWGGRKILTITFGGFVFVYALTQRTAGYIFKLVKVFVQGKVPIEQQNQLYPQVPPDSSQLQNETFYQEDVNLPQVLPPPPKSYKRRIISQNEQIALEALIDLSESTKNKNVEVDLLTNLLSNFTINDNKTGGKNKKTVKRKKNYEIF